MHPMRLLHVSHLRDDLVSNLDKPGSDVDLDTLQKATKEGIKNSPGKFIQEFQCLRIKRI